MELKEIVGHIETEKNVAKKIFNFFWLWKNRSLKTDIIKNLQKDSNILLVKKVKPSLISDRVQILEVKRLFTARAKTFKDF